MPTPQASGLDGIIVAQTALSDVDGEHGKLTVRGYSVEDLVERATFEVVCGLMWNGAWPSDQERDAIAAALADARAYAFDMLPSIGTALDSADSMEALRTAVRPTRFRRPVSGTTEMAVGITRSATLSLGAADGLLGVTRAVGLGASSAADLFVSFPLSWADSASVALSFTTKSADW